MPYGLGPAVAHWANNQGLLRGPVTRAALAQTAAHIDTLLGVGSAAWTTWIVGRTAEEIVENAVSRIATIPGDVARHVFGATTKEGAAHGLDSATTTAVLRAGAKEALVRRYTNQPGVLETDKFVADATIDVPTAGSYQCKWKHIDGLANDEVFLIQKLWITWDASSNTFHNCGLIPGRPWGPFQHTGAVDFYPRENEEFDALDIGISNFPQFMNRVKIPWNIRCDGATGWTPNMMIDLSPNFIPVRSYILIYESSMQDANKMSVTLFGKSVKWLLPFEAFD